VHRPAAIVFAILALTLVLFQLALALGAPWGQAAMGGQYPGVFPMWLRITAVFQAALLGFFGAFVLSRAQVAFPHLSGVARWAIWVIVAFSAVSVLMNLATPSHIERMIWAPVAVLMLITSTIVALSRPEQHQS